MLTNPCFYVFPWKSKGLSDERIKPPTTSSDESIKPPTTSNKVFIPSLDYAGTK